METVEGSTGAYGHRRGTNAAWNRHSVPSNGANGLKRHHARLGETADEVHKAMDDLAAHGLDILTLGQYLPATRMHHEVISGLRPTNSKIQGRRA